MSTPKAFLELGADARTRRNLGYTNAASLVGGFGAWQGAGLPVSTEEPR
jgi:rhodanese-related sulfurtransferase